MSFNKKNTLVYNECIGGETMNRFFTEYTHSIPIIYSHLEGQYRYKLSNPNKPFQILFTEFDYHYISGNIPQEENSVIEEIRNYIEENNPDEFILFSPSTKWENYLSKIMNIIGGVIEFRLSFTLDKSEFERISSSYQFNHKVNLARVTDEKSSSPYYQAEIHENNKLISVSRAFMEGKGNAELDVWTDSKHRYQGLAFEASLVLINKLLDLGFIPNWTCWELKKASHMLAYKLGYINPVRIKAFIWTNEFEKF